MSGDRPRENFRLIWLELGQIGSAALIQKLVLWEGLYLAA